MKDKRIPFIEIPRHKSGRQMGRVSLKDVQVGGSYKFRDPHPLYEGLFFHKNKKGKQQWVSSEAIEQHLSTNRLWKKNNKSKHLASNQRWERNNKDSAQASKNKWRKNNLSKCASYAAKRRRTLKTNIKLKEKDLKKIYDIYEMREDLTLLARSVGCYDNFHVDHIMPLQHPKLCGLHAPWNLQILEASENQSKSNKV